MFESVFSILSTGASAIGQDYIMNEYGQLIPTSLELSLQNDRFNQNQNNFNQDNLLLYGIGALALIALIKSKK